MVSPDLKMGAYIENRQSIFQSTVLEEVIVLKSHFFVRNLSRNVMIRCFLIGFASYVLNSSLLISRRKSQSPTYIFYTKKSLINEEILGRECRIFVVANAGFVVLFCSCW